MQTERKRILITVEMTDDQIFRWTDLGREFGYKTAPDIVRGHEADKRRAIAFALQRFIDEASAGASYPANDLDR